MQVTMLLTEEITEPSSANATREGDRCRYCGGRVSVLVRVEPQTNGPPVTYYACDRCTQVFIRKN